MKWRLPGPQRACAGRETAGELRFGARRERAGLLVPHMDPIDLAAVDGVSDPVQRVADDPVAPLHAGSLQRFDQYIGHSFAHCGTSRVDYCLAMYVTCRLAMLLLLRRVRTSVLAKRRRRSRYRRVPDRSIGRPDKRDAAVDNAAHTLV